MEIVIDTPRGRADVAVSGYDHTTSLADLVERVTRRPAPAVIHVDGHGVSSSTPLAAGGLLHGSIVTTGSPDSAAGARSASSPGATADERDVVVELVQIAGQGSGRRRPLPPGIWAIGAGEYDEAVELDRGIVPEPRFLLDVDTHGACTIRPPEPTDLAPARAPGEEPDQLYDVNPLTDPPARAGSQGAVDPEADDPHAISIDGVTVTGPRLWTGGTLICDDRAFTLCRRPPPASQLRAQSEDGVIGFNRPPRPALAPGPHPLEVPEGGGKVRDKRKFPLLAMLAPIPIAVGMAVLIGNPRFMLFGLLSPVMMLANWISERRDRKKEAKTSTRKDAAARAQFSEVVERAHRAAVDHARSAAPDMGEVIGLATSLSPTLWERRPDAADAWTLPVGLADVEWEPQLVRPQDPLASAEEIIAAAGPLVSIPITVNLADERGIAVIGDEASSRSVARGLLLAAATLHGPADLDIVICTDDARASEWDWAKWLPHVRPAGQVQLLTDRDRIAEWASRVRSAHERPTGSARRERPSRLTFVIVDVEEWWRERTAPLRVLLAEAWLPLRFVVLTDDPHSAPAVCTTLITTPSAPTAVATPSTSPESSGCRATVDYRIQRRSVTGVLPFSVDRELACDVARHLAPLEDADLPVSSSTSIPEQVTTLDVLDLHEPTTEMVQERWGSAARPPRVSARVGMAETGPLEIDLVADGPHGLIAGTTGAGKSELLRSLVAAYATALPPDDLNFVLVDFKGGSAFDACAQLPHTVGVVTDLDEHLAGRVLRCLRAELHHREHVLRDAGASSLDEYQRLRGLDPMARLVLVVDEFASLAAELPEFVPSLVDIAQRGRSLGIHMILATQRPAGVVDAKIKANTNLRIALRVQDDGDSRDVIDTGDAANLPRHLPGRAFARFGAGDIVQFQSGYSTGVTRPDDGQRLAIASWAIGRAPTALECLVAVGDVVHRASEPRDDEASDLQRLVAVIGDAATRLGQSRQRIPYPEPLPERLTAARLSSVDDGEAPGVPIGLVDLPDEQRQTPRRWSPGPDGSLLVFGIPGAGTSSLLASLALAATHRHSPDDLHLYVIDADANLLNRLAGLPHCGAVVGLDDLDRIARLGRVLAAELSRRKRLVADSGSPGQVVAAEPSIVLMIDNVGTLRQVLDDSKGHQDVWGTFDQILRDGQSLGMCTIVTAKHERAIPGQLASQFQRRLVMRLGDPQSYASFGFKTADVPQFVPGRALCPEDGTELQIVAPPDDLAAAVADSAARSPTVAPAGSGRPADHGAPESPLPVSRRPRRVDPLPTSITLGAVLHAGRTTERHLALPVGLDTSDAEPALLHVEPGNPVLVLGPKRCGRSTMLAVLANAAAAVAPDVSRFALCTRGGPLVEDGQGPPVDIPDHPSVVREWVDRIVAAPGHRLVLVDDADRLHGPSLEKLAAHADELLLVLTGRAEAMRSFDHWTKPLQATRTGVLLRPTPADADALGVTFGLTTPRFETGQGIYVNDGESAPLLAATLGDGTDGR